MNSSEQSVVGRPTELAITLATFPGQRAYTEWVTADEVAHRLKLFGFDCSAQQTAAWLARMSRADAPWVERRRDRWDEWWEYRVTRYGRNDIDNRLPGVWWARDRSRQELRKALAR